MKVHWCKFNEYGWGYAACSGWFYIPYTLYTPSVTCKKCQKMIQKANK